MGTDFNMTTNPDLYDEDRERRLREDAEGLLDGLVGQNHDPSLRRFANKCVVAGMEARDRQLSLAYRRIGELEAQIGCPPAGSHPNEAKPRAATWHAERLNWIEEMDATRKSLRDVEGELHRIADAAGIAQMQTPNSFVRASGLVRIQRLLNSLRHQLELYAIDRGPGKDGNVHSYHCCICDAEAPTGAELQRAHDHSCVLYRAAKESQ